MAFGGKHKLNTLEGFIIGGAASMSAAVCTHPIDLIKVQMQLDGMGESKAKLKGPVETAVNVVRTRGVSGLYQGLSASLTRQITYSSTRFGVYAPIKNFITDDPNPNMFQKILAGMLAGAVGAAVGTPADLVMVRMQADSRLPVNEQVYKYKNIFDGLQRIVTEEGPLALWRGCNPTVVRAMLVTASQLGVYDILKGFVLSHKLWEDGLAVHFTCSFLAGFAASVVTNPVDVVKTRLMQRDLKYKGLVDCFMHIARTEGFRGLYKGFVPNFMRLGPQTILTFLFYEQFVSLYSFAKRKAVN